MIDDESEPGSWKLALKLGPWRKIGPNTYTNSKEYPTPAPHNTDEAK